jgi:hypothetical protein
MPIVAAPEEPFDPRKHQLPEGGEVPPGAVVDETLAPGFVFQGRLLRPIIVRLAGSPAAAAAPAGAGAEGNVEGAGPAGAAPGTGTASTEAGESVSFTEPPAGLS